MAEYNENDFLTLYPGKFSEGEKELGEQYIKECEAINARGPIDVEALIAGTLPADTPGVEKIFPVPEALVKYQNNRIDPENRVINDPEYARSLGYKDIYALLTFAPHTNVDKAFPPVARDTVMANQLNGNITALRPIYPGDTLYLVVDHREVRDLTPPQGSTHRYLAISGEASTYNQLGEKVNEMNWNITEAIRIFKEGKRPKPREEMGFMDCWEAPNWLKRPAHHYSEDDWQFIMNTWKNEKRQGGELLYWEDVNIGDEPTPTLDGPIFTGAMPHESSGHGKGGSKNLKEFMLNADRETLDQDPITGIYRPKDMAAFVPAFPKLEDDTTDERGESFSEAEIHAKSAEREVLMNYVMRDISLRHINNWMGDHGWLKTIRWEIMSPELMKLYGKEVPAAPYIKNFMRKIPYMREKILDAHPLSDDIALVHSCVTDKYVQNGEFLVELTWWAETIDHYIPIDGQAIVRLPSRG